MKNQRFGNFSSSEIHKLTKPGRAKDAEFSAPGLTYIKEKSFELKLGRALSSEQGARATSWGTFVEERAFKLLDMSYKLESKIRLAHPTVKHWTGAPDTIRREVVGDIKCPWTLKSFCESIEAMEKGVAEFKSVRPEYYWQLVSSAILTGKDKAEIIIYVPYLSELEEIREDANNYDGDQNKIAFINWAGDNELPYLIDGGHYKNLNKLEFEIPLEDKVFLTDRVELAIKLLNK
jgi:hypothetical protein